VIIQIRGTNGSGKSTIVRDVMSRYEVKTQIHEAGRRRPLAYELGRNPGKWLYVPGHYEIACGGCDTISSPERVYELVRAAVERGMDALYEGIIIGDDVTRCAALAKEHQLVVIALDVPIEECLEAIRSRRQARGDGRPLKEDNTRNRLGRLKRITDRLNSAGVETYWMNRSDALAFIIRTFDLGSPIKRPDPVFTLEFE